MISAEMKAIGATGTIDDDGRLTVDEPVRALGPGRVRLLILAPETAQTEESPPAPDPEEREWLAAAASNPTFAFLHDPAADIYSLEDGRPFHG